MSSLIINDDYLHFGVEVSCVSLAQGCYKKRVMFSNGGLLCENFDVSIIKW